MLAIPIRNGCNRLAGLLVSLNPDRNGAHGTRHPRLGAIDCGAAISQPRAAPNPNSNPERSETLLGPSQGALQLNQATQRLYDDGAVIQTSNAAQLRTARSKIKICM
ncbi:hypothetical protein PGT21_001064 [Puccinia graminis f. sp. tritici]|uniref:Uncharacterized protein n=1 Tax=Puccinia graminis f. sp. tritici TaxID=56615 RepID=A0A5B0NX90_PUCGR|nr:hypothetical protein PGT21_001064 [Puccinia graminis f. sp. tritici]KAA1105090.1 hypothetical protein PGTUg99_005434 [Puccinia graminis f. sp. tritici]